MMDITTLGNQRIDQKTFEQLLKHIKLKVTEEYANTLFHLKSSLAEGQQ